MANKKKKQRHLTLTDRIYIEQELVRGSSFTDIGNALGKDPSTISKEVRHHYEVTKDTLSTRGCRSCTNYNECTLQRMCGSLVCNKKCRACGRFRRFRKCDNENFIYCSVPHKPPYVCNGCDSRQTCHFEKHVYHARKAQAEYEEELVNSRVGINMTKEELRDLNDLISPLMSLANYVNVRQNVRNSSGMYTPSRWYTRPGYINGFANGWENVGTTAVTEVGDMGDRSVPEGSEYVEHKILYSGEDEVGVIMRMHATGPASGVAVHDITTGESMRIDSTRLRSITGSDIIAGDDIVISTVVGDKYINLVRGGVSKNILNALTRDSEWFKLVLGENTFAYTAKRGFYNLQFTIENRILFEGV